MAGPNVPVDGGGVASVTATSAVPAIDPATRRKLAVDLYNHTWALLAKPDRTRAEDDEMIHGAHASRLHWGEVADHEPVNLARGEWLCSRVYAVLGRAEPSLWHARRCLDIDEEAGVSDWDIAVAYEAMARAAFVARRPRPGRGLEGEGDRRPRRDRRGGRSGGRRGRPRDAPVVRAPTLRSTSRPLEAHMSDVKLGILLWSQAATYAEMLDAAKRVDRLGYDHLWTWDHLYSIFGDPYQPIFEGWSLLNGWARETEQVRLGLLVGANTFRNPGLVAKTVATLDHASDGRAILGIGGAWNELEHKAHGIEFGTGFGQRLDWLDESVGAIRRVLDGGAVTSEPGGRYQFDDLRHLPAPVQPHLPIMIGGGGEKKTLRTVARYADMWNGMGPLDVVAHKVEVLRGHCEGVGRDFAEIELTLGVKVTIRDTEADADRAWKAAMEYNRTPMARVEQDTTFWNGTPVQLADRLRPYLDLGFRTVISEQPAPYDVESLERFIGEVVPLVASA